MRPLTEEEMKNVLEKLSHYIGSNIKLLVERNDEEYVFRLHKKRVYYLAEDLMKKAMHVARKRLVAMGTALGKFTASGRFLLEITCLDYLAQYAQFKVWVKPSSELSFLYGNHVLKAGLGRITDGTPKNQGVVVYNMQDVPLGFGTTAYSTSDCRRVDGTAIVCFNQSDVGEYLRDEDGLSSASTAMDME
ncbi:60S ribosome subunit biogenesis protein NIP7 [Thecamonas trahens ATCC 50062]|uniref:60S ribosome subunit biogenesis protein NIP7 homolog n=1 Tax=Thecamonas trahens ATCC 50062 TaxID=461836 RepID=A0A0L0DD35_THETB|nr:60S ribosome subunit biogenesis protein NIP7 [Thecamonas trahens ATCC 50062]KNC49238.1 60S ribosome subunit biogenesis protein NIP7 [Thecamonas trahens ATCC 50062]|eukprot:XP_013757955.1 60S ribosome subunit biogenesis protein NIP7 [Thecamonas trahens ATCC 50062]